MTKLYQVFTSPLSVWKKLVFQGLFSVTCHTVHRIYPQEFLTGISGRVG